MSGASTDIEVRLTSEWRASGRKLEGLAAIFDEETTIGDFTEVVRPGAFTRSLAAGGDILALVDHDPARLLARTRTGSLMLSETKRGLAFSLQVPNTQDGNDALALAERGDLGGMSFGFRIPAGGEVWEGRSRQLVDVDLMEISVVSAWPAYAGTTVTARSRVMTTPRLNRARLILKTVS